MVCQSCSLSNGLVLQLGLGLGLGTENRYFIPFFFLKVTNTFVFLCSVSLVAIWCKCDIMLM